MGVAVARNNARGGAITITAAAIDLRTVTPATPGVLPADKCDAGSGRPGVDGGLRRLLRSGSCTFITGTKKEMYLQQLCPPFPIHALLPPPSTVSQRVQVSGAIELHYLLADKKEVGM